MKISLPFLFLVSALSGHLVHAYNYETKYYQQKVDHFSYANRDTYSQRYLVNQDSWTPGKPIFFYAGNEGDIQMFANNTGLMWDWAPEFGAMLVFAEHRYYGTSQPYGDKSYSDLSYLGYLTVEQALADFATLISYLKETTPGLSSSPVIVFGGSYGGMLAAWFRIKYPHVVAGALAASAPILQFQDQTPCNVYFQIVTKDFQDASPECAQTIRKSWAAIRGLAKNGDGLAWLTQNFRLCAQLVNTDVDLFMNFLSQTWQNAAMTDYPYPTSFLMPIPGNPVNVMCDYLQDSSKPDKELLLDVFKALSVFQNYTGSAQCFNISVPGGAALGDLGWDFQSCTEMVMPMCTNGVTDMFELTPWNLTLFTRDCQKKWGPVTPEQFKAAQVWGGSNITASSNIIFSNGKLDPWSGGGVLTSLSDSLVAILIDNAAHHLDLRSSNPNDPQAIRQARELEKTYIRKWIKQYYRP